MSKNILYISVLCTLDPAAELSVFHKHIIDIKYLAYIIILSPPTMDH